VKLEQEGIQEVTPKPRKNARLGNGNSFPINKTTSKNRAFMRGFLKKGLRGIGQPAQTRQLPYNMGYCSENRTFVLSPRSLSSPKHHVRQFI
jgi:hypothetical protein